MKKKLLSLVLSLSLTLSAFGGLSPACAAGASSTAYTFGEAGGPWPDLYAEHRKEAKQREKERKKAEEKEAKLEKAAMKKAAREAAREREKKDKAAKENTEQKA